MSYQGVLIQGGIPVSGATQMTVSIFDNAVAGKLLYTETQSVQVVNGTYNILLGSVNPLPDSVALQPALWIAVQVNGGTELTPRTQVGIVTNSIRSESAGVADALVAGAKGVVTSVNGADGTLTFVGSGTTTINRTGNQIQIASSGGTGTGVQGVQSTDGTLKISNSTGPIVSVGVADSAISTTKLAASAVTTAKIADNSITNSKIVLGTIAPNRMSTTGATQGTVLTSPMGGVPVWQLVDLTSSVSGVLPVTNGGTGQSAPLVQGGILYGASATAAASSPAGTQGQVLTSAGSVGPTWQTPSFVPSGALIAFPDAGSRSGYSYTGAVTIHEGWTTLSSAGAIASSEQCAVACGGKVYVFGGWAPNFVASNRVQQYDPATDQWTTKSNTGFTPGFGAGATLVGSKIYVVCAVVGMGQISHRTEVYDPSADSWASKAPVPYSVETPVVVTLGKYVFCISGHDSTFATTNRIQIYDTTSNTWSQGNSGGFTARTRACGAQVNSKIYIFGGAFAGPRATNEVWEYDASGSTPWQLKSSSGFTPRFAASCAVVDNKIYVFGGWNDLGKPVNAVEVYDPLRDRWDAVQVEGWTPRVYSSAASLGGRIYVFGGGNQDGPTEVVSTHAVLDPNAIKEYWFRKN